MHALQERNDTLKTSQTGNIFAIAEKNKAYLFHVDWTFKRVIVCEVFVVYLYYINLQFSY